MLSKSTLSVMESFYGYTDSDGYWVTERDPKTDPNCATYGCPEGRACQISTDCANGLNCKAGICTKYSPFNSKNAAEIKLFPSKIDNKAYAAERRAYYDEAIARDYLMRQQARDKEVTYPDEDLITKPPPPPKTDYGVKEEERDSPLKEYTWYRSSLWGGF